MLTRRTVLSAMGALGAAVAAGCGGDDDGDDAGTAAATVATTPVGSAGPTDPSTTANTRALAPQVLRYGDDPSQFADLTWPTGADGDAPIGVVVHGGFWKAAYGLEYGAPLAASLVEHGWAALNVEYRRVGNGGGYPATLDDVGAAIDALVDVDGIDRSRVVVIGHSAGGHLAAWAATREDPIVAVTSVVAQAGVLDLRQAAADCLGGGAVQALLGGEPQDVPERYAAADPSARLPIGVPVLCVHARDDDLVPFTQSETFVAAASAAGDDARLVDVDGDHFVVIDPASAAWAAVLDFLAAR